VTGNPWNLPMTQFKITVTRHVVGCGTPIKASVESIVTPVLVLDPDQRYLLRSTGWLATSDITSTLSPSGVSTGLNAQSTDTTATVISNVVSTVGQFAVLAAAAGAAAGAPMAVAPELCQTPTRDAVRRLYPDVASGQKSLKAKVDDDTAALNVATAKVALLTAETNVDKTLKPQLLSALRDQATAQKQLSDDQEQMTKDLNATTDTQVITWPLKAADFVQDTPFQLDLSIYAKWANAAMDSTEGRKQFDVYLALYVRGLDGSWGKPPLPATADVKVGIPVRVAASGRLLVCSGGTKCPNALPANAAPDKKLIASDYPVLQLGQMYVVPVTGGWFRSESATIALDANGLPTSIQSSEKAAAAAGLSGSAKDTATQLAGLPASVRAAQLARTQTETTQLTANAALATAEASAGIQGQANTLAAQTALVTAQNNYTTAKQNAGLQVQTSEVSTQSALLTAQASLVTAQASSQVVDQTSVLAAQTTLINAQTAKINAAAALAKAQAAVP